MHLAITEHHLLCTKKTQTRVTERKKIAASTCRFSAFVLSHRISDPPYFYKFLFYLFPDFYRTHSIKRKKECHTNHHHRHKRDQLRLLPLFRIPLVPLVVIIHCSPTCRPKMLPCWTKAHAITIRRRCRLILRPLKAQKMRHGANALGAKPILGKERRMACTLSTLLPLLQERQSLLRRTAAAQTVTRP